MPGSYEVVWSAIALGLLLVQVPAVLILLSRLVKGPTRQLPLQPQRSVANQLGIVSILVPTLNEANRITPCLEGLARQGYEVREILIVDSNSQDGTRDLVKSAQLRDPRFRLLSDDPLPPGWVGRPWALHTGFLNSSDASAWVLGIDADTQPQLGLVSSLLQAATAGGYDIVSLSPRFILKYPGELLLQPSLLLTLIYRFGPSGAVLGGAERVMANGQCFLCRRSLLVQMGGYSAARASFCDDVTLARYAAQQGAKVGFLDGANVLKVRMYEGWKETWTEWGRSLDLKDASSPGQKWGDLWFLIAVQGLPWVAVATLLPAALAERATLPIWLAVGLNLALLLIRFALLLAIAPSYDLPQRVGWLFWLSPLTDPLAIARIALSSFQTPTRWRGRDYKT